MLLPAWFLILGLGVGGVGRIGVCECDVPGMSRNLQEMDVGITYGEGVVDVVVLLCVCVCE